VPPDGRAAVFVMPSQSAGQIGPVAVWITAAGWASAAGRLWGSSWILTPEGVLTPDEAVAMATRPSARLPDGPGWRRLVPQVVRLGAKDVRQVARARRFRDLAARGPWDGSDLAFVWQRHDLFHTAGFRLAREHGKPLVLFVDAPLVWEARKWGVRRPGWGRLVELAGETPQFRSADLVACVSDEVAEEVGRRGVPADRIVVTPCGVDADAFSPNVSGEAVRGRLGLEGRFVVGWVGSFRRFHGVDIALRAAALLRERVPDLALLLVGDGFERSAMERLAGELALRNVVFTGTVAYPEVAEYIAAMDVALVLDRGDQGFHYSPLKLKEYMACGRSVVGPRVGELARHLIDGRDGLLVRPGDPAGLADAVERLSADPSLRLSLGATAREKALLGWTWDRQLATVLERLGSLDPALEHRWTA